MEKVELKVYIEPFVLHAHRNKIVKLFYQNLGLKIQIPWKFSKHDLIVCVIIRNDIHKILNLHRMIRFHFIQDTWPQGISNNLLRTKSLHLYIKAKWPTNFLLC